jgi:hypothetical protein
MVDKSTDNKACYRQIFHDGYHDTPRKPSKASINSQKLALQKVNATVLNQFAKSTTETNPMNETPTHSNSDSLLGIEIGDSNENLETLVESIHQINDDTDLQDEVLAQNQGEMLCNPRTKSSFRIDYLLHLSEEFLTQAHSQVLLCNAPNGQLNYFKLVKLSIKSLHLVVQNYHRHLSSDLLLKIYYKLAKVYFFDTASIDLAEKYIYKSISVASKNNLIQNEFVAEYLQVQILQKSNPNIVLNHLDEKIDQFSSNSNLGTFFKILKIQTLLLTDCSRALIHLQTLCKNSHTVLQIYCLLLQGNLHLYRGNPKQCLCLLDDVDLAVSTMVDNSTIPVQLEAMTLLLRLHTTIRMNNYSSAKVYMKRLSNFIMEQQNLGWKSWNEDGVFELTLPVSSDDNSVTVPCQISWLNSDEFVIMYYFFTAICLFYDANKSKSKKVFEKCIQIIEKQLLQLTGDLKSSRNLTLQQLKKKVIRLKFIKYNVNYYQAWLMFLNSDFSSISHLNEYMLAYNNQEFTDEEYSYFKLLMPRIFYLIAIYYQFQGDVQAAKYYYCKVHNMESTPPDSSRRTWELQFELGLGCDTISPQNEFSELYIFSTMHLLILNEFEWSELSEEGNRNSKTYHYKVNSELQSRLMQAFDRKKSSNEFDMNFVSCDELVQLTYQSLLRITTGTNDQENHYVDTIVNVLRNHKFDYTYAFTYKLFLYIAYTKCTDLAIKMKFQEKCLKTIAEPCLSDSDRMINTLILKGLVDQFKLNGEMDKANMAELQMQYFCDSLHEKFHFLLNNVDTNLQHS